MMKRMLYLVSLIVIGLCSTPFIQGISYILNIPVRESGVKERLTGPNRILVQFSILLPPNFDTEYASLTFMTNGDTASGVTFPDKVIPQGAKVIIRAHAPGTYGNYYWDVTDQGTGFNLQYNPNNPRGILTLEGDTGTVKQLDLESLPADLKFLQSRIH